MKATRIAVVNSHPVQYSAPLYAYANRDPSLDITALYCTDYSLRGAQDPGFKQSVKWDLDLLGGYGHVFLGKRARTRSINGFWSLVVPELWTEIRSGKYDAVWLHGYAYAAYVLAFIAAKSKGLPVFMRSETHLLLTRARWKQWLRDSVLARIYRYVDRFLAVGSANHDYYRYLGIAPGRIHLVPYTVDNERFMAASRLQPDERATLRQELGLPANLPVLMFVSKFMPRKHPECVLKAADLLRKRGIDVAVLMVGAGDMDGELRALAAELALPNVVFPGFINQTQLPRIYATADVFVLPSADEPWGFIINEIMCAGLPVIASGDIGSVPDLVHDGINGRLMKAGDPVSLAAAVEDILSDPLRRAEMGQRSLAIISDWNYERCRLGLVDAVTPLPSGAGARSRLL